VVILSQCITSHSKEEKKINKLLPVGQCSYLSALNALKFIGCLADMDLTYFINTSKAYATTLSSALTKLQAKVDNTEYKLYATNSLCLFDKTELQEFIKTQQLSKDIMQIELNAEMVITD